MLEMLEILEIVPETSCSPSVSTIVRRSWERSAWRACEACSCRYRAQHRHVQHANNMRAGLKLLYM